MLQTIKLAVVTLVAATAVSSVANAYSIGTHKYETQLMLLHAGIDPAIADRLSTYAQWVDESRLNSAMNPIPFLHMRHSRMMHFPTQGIDPLEALLLKAAKREKVDDTGHATGGNIFDVAERDSLIANEAFNEALKTGNPYLMGASLHVLMDSYAHEGFNYIKGHGDRGHFPDRPWLFQEKHNEMRKKLFLAMARIREVLPQNGLSDLRIDGKLAREMTPEELYESYVKQPEIIKATSDITHKDPLYTGEAMNLVIERMITEGVAQPALKSLVFDRWGDMFFAKDAEGLNYGGWDIMREIVARLYQLPAAERAQFVDTERMERRYAAVVNKVHEYKVNGKTVQIASRRQEDIGQDSIQEAIAKELVHRLVPVPALGDSDNQPGAKDTFEDERLVAREDRIVRSLWQEAGLKIYNLSPTLLVKPPLIGKLKSLMSQDVGENGERLEADLKTLDSNIAHNQILSSMTRTERVKWMWAMEKYIIVDFATYRLTSWFKLVGAKPIGNLRLTNSDVADAKEWQHYDFFQEAREKGVFKMIYTSKQVDDIKGKYAAQEEAFAETKAKLRAGTMLSPRAQVDEVRGQFLPRYSEQLCRDIFK